MKRRWFAVALLVPVLALAQGTVYESKDKAGPVYSDKPSPGAKPADLPPLNVIEMPQAPAPGAVAPAVASAYRKFAIVAPEPQGTIHSNTGAFAVRFQIEPALRKGDVVRVKLDGKLLAGRYASPEVALTEADWAAANPDNVEHRLQAAILDADGKLLVESAPVSFYVHRATRK